MMTFVSTHCLLLIIAAILPVSQSMSWSDLHFQSGDPDRCQEHGLWTAVDGSVLVLDTSQLMIHIGETTIPSQLILSHLQLDLSLTDNQDDLWVRHWEGCFCDLGWFGIHCQQPCPHPRFIVDSLLPVDSHVCGQTWIRWMDHEMLPITGLTEMSRRNELTTDERERQIVDPALVSLTSLFPKPGVNSNTLLDRWIEVEHFFVVQERQSENG